MKTKAARPRDPVSRRADAAREASEVALTPLRQVRAFWSWLPAFRAVAECGGVVSAGRALSTSPSALSRAVRLLEDAVGEPLFARGARALTLTRAGEELLSATRVAMRTVHDAAAADRAPSGPLAVGATSRLGIVRLLPALRSLRRRHPDIQPTASSVAHPEVAQMLVAGRLDLAITLAPVAHPDLACDALSPAKSAVFCGVDHPLFRKPKASTREIQRHAFAAPALGPGDRELDGWPEPLARRVALRAAVMDPGVDACLGGELLAVLPLEVVGVLGLSDRLRLLRAVAIADSPVFAVRRKPLSSRLWPADVMMVDLVKRRAP